MFRTVLLLTTLTGALILSAQSKLHMPLKITPAFAGNYGELRRSHFHMGLDFRTNERTGYNIYSSEDGYVRRINISRTGYGKCLYIDHPHLGVTTVYAHLKGFAPHIQRHIDSVLDANKVNEIEYYPPPYTINVARGEKVAISGNTGSSSGPHLHYEVRNMTTEKTINPLHFFDYLADTKKPLYSHNYIYGITGNEVKYYKTIEVSKYQNKTITVPYDKIGIGVRVIDYMNHAPNKLGIYRIAVYENEVLSYLFQMDSLDFEWSGHTKSVSDYSLPSRDVYRAFTNPCAFNITNPNSHLNGVISLHNNEVKNIKIVVQDYYGNYRVSQFKINLGSNIINPKPKDFICSIENNFTIDKFKISLPPYSIPSEKNLKLIPLKTTTNAEIYKFKFMSDHDAVLKKYTITYDNSLKYKKLFLEGKYDRKKRKYLPDSHGNNLVFKKIKNFGTFTLKTDNNPPYINPKYSKTSSYLSFYIKDIETDVDTYDFYVNGEWRHIYYDLKSKKVSYKIRPQDRGLSSLCELRVTDLLGNSSVKKIKIVF